MPFGVVAAEVAPEVIGGVGADIFSEGAGAALTSEFGGDAVGSTLGGGGLDMFSADAGGELTNAYGGNYLDGNAGGLDMGAPGGGTPGGGTSWMDKLSGVGNWMQQNPMLTKLGIGALLGGASALNSRNIANQNAAIQQAALQRQLQRQALMDNPPPFASMSGPGLTPTNNWGANVDAKPSFSYADLKNYGAGPEQHWAASGGLAEHTPMHGGLEQARMVDHPEGGGQEDNVPAMLSPKEYVLDADVVSAIGDGNPDEGARRLDAFRERVRAHKRAAPSHRIPPKAYSIDRYMRGSK